MSIKRNGTVLISTMIILTITSFIGTALFKMSKNNIEKAYIYTLNGDIFNISNIEEENLKKFMIKLNEMDSNEIGLFTDDFKNVISESTLVYKKQNNSLILKTKINNEEREREINYTWKQNKLILIPTYKFLE